MSVKITELPILDSLADNDIVAGVDVSGNVTSKIEMSTLKNYIDTNTQYTAGTNIDITNNVISAPDVYNKNEMDNQIEELQSEVDSLSTIFNAFPTESGEGESLTLDDTAEVKFKKFDLKGNTSQTTYSGKNLLINARDEGYTVTSNGITFKVNVDKSITVSGTATGIASMALNTGVPVTLSAGTYTLSKKETTDVQVAIWYDSTSVWTAVRGNTTAIQKTISETTTFNNWRTLVVVYQGVTVNTTVYPMLEKSSTETSYEPYVGGTPSPNPTYPQPVNVVSGDNEINVCGKNLYNSSDTTYYQTCTYVSGANTNQYKVKATGTDVIVNSQISSGTSYSSIAGTLIPCKYGETIYYDTGNSNFGKNIVTQYNANKVSLGFSALNTGSSSGSYTPNNSECEYISIRIGNGSATSGTEYTLAPIFSKTSNLTYEPYIGNTYNIDLPVENLWGGFSNSFTRTDFGVQFTANQDGTITANGTATNTATSILLSEAASNGIYKTLQKGTYTVSGGGAKYNVEIYDKNNVVRLGGIDVNGSKVSFTINEETQIVLRIQVANGVTINETIKLQIEKGTKANTYTPYGTTPIELCKIGTYRDYFYKDSDKWYLHKEIGKVVFTGGNDETWEISETSTQGSNRFLNGSIKDYILKPINNNTPIIAISNYFTPKTANQTYTNIEGISASASGNIHVYADSLKNYTVAQFKTWLSTHNLVIYYILATSTNTEITYQPLIDQLNLLEQAQSKENQTNISQVNNDLPFIISASALKEWSV